jgi:hypothetical protein
MWIFYYKSEERIRQIASQIDPTIAIEKSTKNKKSGSLKAEFDMKTAKLMNLLGFEAKGNLNAEGQLDNECEIKYKILDDTIINRVCAHLSNAEHYTYLSNDSLKFTVSNIRKLVKFKGRFVPEFLGKNPREKTVELESRKSLILKSNYHDVFMTITISIDSVISKTPLYTCIENYGVGLDIEGYGIFSGKTGDNDLIIIPLFFGVYLEI